jgi:hypothetical protein
MNDDERLIQLLSTGGAAFRASELQRAHEFHELLRARRPAFYRHLREAVLGSRPAAEYVEDRRVEINKSFDLGVAVSFEVQRQEEMGDFVYRAAAFALCVEGRELRGNASLEKLLVTGWSGDGDGRKPAKTEQVCKLVTNEAWPTRTEPFIKKGKSLKAARHQSMLAELARQEGLELAEGLLEELFEPVDQRLVGIFRGLRGARRVS